MTRTVLATLAAIAALPSVLIAQQGNAAPPIYISATSYHINDEHRTDYETWLKTRYRKYAEELMKRDSSVVSVLATRVIFGGVIEPEANAYVSIARNNYPRPNPELSDKIAQDAFSKSYADFLAEARPLRKRLGQVLVRRVVGTPASFEEGDLMRYDFKKVTPGRMGDYVQLERDYERLRAAQVQAGNMTGWGMFVLMLPGGTEREFDAYTVHTGKTLEQVMTWGQNTGPIAAKLDPPFNLTGLAMRAPELQKIARSEVRLVVLGLRRK